MHSLDIVLLGLVSVKPRHGYEVLKEMQDRGIRNLVRISNVAIYKALARLEKEEFLRSHKEKDGKSPERNVYSITESGKTYLQDLIYQFLSSDEPLRNEYLVVFDFLYHLNFSECVLGLEERINKLKRIRQNLLTKLSVLKDVQPFIYSESLKHQCEIYDLEIKWLERILSHISREGTLESLYQSP